MMLGFIIFATLMLAGFFFALLLWAYAGKLCDEADTEAEKELEHRT